MRLSLSKVLLLVTALAIMPATAQAEDILTPAVPTLSCTAGGSPGFTPTYFACSGAWAGNNMNQQTDVLAQIMADWGGIWSFVGTTNEGETSGPFLQVDGATSGYVKFDLPITGSFILALKAANQFSLYYFKNVVDLAEVEFSTAGVALNAQFDPQALSHASLYSAVPEPSTVILLGTGLLGLFGVEYRRRKKA